jgi:WD40 repeat protein
MSQLRPVSIPADARGATVDEAGAPRTLLQRLGKLPLVSRAQMLPGQPEPSPAGSDAPPPSLPGYEVLSVLGRGGMAVVYKARHLGLKRLVALKMILSGANASPEVRSRFQREAEAVAQLQHPNIVQVYEVGAHGGLPYLALEYVSGGTLAQSLDSRPLPARPAAALAHTLAGAVHFAHGKGVLHRDLKPANILIADGGLQMADSQNQSAICNPPSAIKITDFGLAKQLDRDASQTQSGAILGTPSYMAPEQAQGHSGAVGPAADVYGLGAILYQVLTGRPPFLAATNLETVQQVVSREPVPPRRLQPNLPRDLETICLKCLEKEPARRYPSAGALADDLRRFLQGEPIQARPATAWERGWKWMKRRPTAATLLAVSVLAVLGFLISGWWYNVNLRLAKRQADDQRLEADQRRQQADTNLYHSLVGEARALRLARESGYRSKAWERLKQARWLETPDKDLDELRHEAVACLGDFVGLVPTERPNPGTSRVKGQRLALHPDGVQLALGLSDGAVLLYDLTDGVDRERLRGHQAEISGVAFGPDGRRLVTADVGGEVKIWQSHSRGAWTCAHTLRADRPPNPSAFDAITAVALSSDGRHVAACPTGATTIQVWNLEDGTAAAPFHSPNREQLRVLAWSPDGRLLAAGYNSPDKGLVVWDVATRQCQHQQILNLGVVFTLTFSPDSRRLAVGCNQGAAVFDTSAFPQRPFPVQGDQVHSLAFSPDGRLLFIASEAVGVVRLWDLASNRQLAELKHPGGPFAVALSRDGGTLFTASRKSLRAWNLRGPEEKLVLFGHDGGVPHVAFSPDGKLLASSGKDHTVRIWNPATGEPLQKLPDLPGQVEAVAFSPDGRKLAAADMAGTLRLWEVSSWKDLPTADQGLGRIWTIAFGPDGYFAAGGTQGLRIWRVDERGAGLEAPGLMVQPPAGSPAGEFTALCFSPNGKRLACVRQGRADGDHRVYLYDLPSGQARELPARLQFFVRALAFSPNSRHLIFVSDKQVVEVWDVAAWEATGRPQVVSFGSEDLVSGYGGIALSADGAWFACGNQAVTIWDTASRKLLLRLPEERSTVWSLAWSPDRERLAITSSDGGLVVWNLHSIRAQLAEVALDW